VTRRPTLGGAVRRLRRAVGGQTATGGPSSRPGYHIDLDYAVHPIPRYGYGKPAHPELDALLRVGTARYRGVLETFLPLVDQLAAIPLDTSDPTEPCWHNGWFQGLDAVALYGFLATTRPARYIEVGSGHSTRFARRAIRDHGLATTITSIDPQPRAEIDTLCDRVIRRPLEDVDLAVFAELAPGDICFFDGSHRVFMNSDATVSILEVLPRLPTGVLVHVHDIFLPWDYPPQLQHLHWSEQYLLGSMLLGGNELAEVVLPNFLVCIEPALHHVLDALWDRFTWSATPTNGLSFWLRRR